MTCPASVIIGTREYRCNLRQHGEGLADRHCHDVGSWESGVAPLAMWRQDVPLPEQEWRPGDIVQDATGEIVIRRSPDSEGFGSVDGEGGRVWTSGGRYGVLYLDESLARPLTQLFPATVDLA